MGVINLVTGICCAILTAEVVYMVVSIVVRDRAGRIAFLRSFKKGKCAIIYFSTIPLFCLGHMYAGMGFMEAFFSAVNQIINLVVLKYSTSTVQALMGASAFYRVTMYYSFILVGLNALFFTFSLFGQRVWEFVQERKAKSASKDRLFIFGYNQNSVAIYNSETQRSKVIVDKISAADRDRMYAEKISFVSCDDPNKIVEQIFRLVENGKRKYTVIINTDDEDKNLSISRSFISKIETYDQEGKEKVFERLRVYVFGDPRYETIHIDAMTNAYGCLHYVNKYQMIAMDFIDRYPFTKFMGEEQIDYATALIKNNVDINVCMIGFGKTNQQIFLTSVANNQFLHETESEIKLKQVKYYIFDKNPAKNNKNLNHSYYRFRNEREDIDPKDYLPLPSVPAEETYFELDINDPNFYRHIRHILSAEKPHEDERQSEKGKLSGKQKVNFVIIAFGTDLENIDMAQKLIEKKQEWGIEDLTIFVKTRAKRAEQTLLQEKGCYFIGNEKESVYNINCIIGDRIFHMAQMRNEAYAIEYKITHEANCNLSVEALDKVRKNADKSWYLNKTQLERESNLYCCLSMRSKLNLIGLDYCPKTENDKHALTEREYLDNYAAGDHVDTETLGLSIDGKKVVNYTLDFVPSKRTNLAIQEHQRWNSFMISKGMVPSSIKQIEEEKTIKNGVEKFTNGKNYKLRRHGNITSMDGLVEFRKIIANRDKIDELEADVIKYDYQLMDDAFWLLDRFDFKIVKKDDLKKGSQSRSQTSREEDSK